MTDVAADSGSDAQITFKVKTSSDGLHVITITENATVLDLKTKLSTPEFENIPVERQRLIYSGRVMKNDDTLATYKIKQNNTVHMVKSAASNPPQPASSSTPTPQAVPSNMASGTANNPLAGLTGARYAGQQINLPGMEMFGPDGGMGPPMDEERLQRMMADPNVQQSMNEALNNSNFIDMLIRSNPTLQSIPNARQMISSPFMRQLMTNPQLMRQAMRMQRSMQGGNPAFPAPGVTDTTPEGAAASGNGQNNGNSNENNDNSNNSNATQQNPFLNSFTNPFMAPGGAGAGAGAGAGVNPAQLLQQLTELGLNPFGNPASGQIPSGQTTTDSGATPGQTTSGSREPSQTPGSTQNPPSGNPFSMLFPSTNAQQGSAQEGSQANPFGIPGSELQRMMQFLGGGAAAAPADNRPPEERYAEQLRQLNDMGFFDFDRNVAALRRSGGSVQGAIEHLLGATD